MKTRLGAESELDAVLEGAAESNADSKAAAAHPPFLGPVTDLNDLPQPMIADLDQKAAGEMQDAINNPERYPADHLNHTSIRGLNATGSPGAQKKDGDPWYHRGLPPLHLEVALVGYDWMVGEAIDRAARQINELTEAKEGYYVLDSYDPIAGEIISRKETQLSEIKLKTAIEYLTQFVRRYPPGRRILPVKNAGRLGNDVLRGKMLLEVPVQLKPIPKPVFEKATQLEIRIRDVNGHIYN